MGAELYRLLRTLISLSVFICFCAGESVAAPDAHGDHDVSPPAVGADHANHVQSKNDAGHKGKAEEQHAGSNQKPAVEEKQTGAVELSDNADAPDFEGESSSESPPSGSWENGKEEKLAAVLLLDSSGSMRLTDPARLRDEGVKLFIQFLKPGDKVAIVAFDRSARTVWPLAVYAREQDKELSEAVAKIGNEGLYTDLLAGVQAAAEILSNIQEENVNRTIVLLSDGKMDPDPEVGKREVRTSELLNTLLPDLKAKRIRIHTLAFSDEADRGLLAEIATATDAINWFTPEAEKIHESYAELFLAVKKPQFVPLTSKGFRIDPDIKEATFYINREGAQGVGLVTPDGEEIGPHTTLENVKWFSGKKFDVVTIEKPPFGDWKVLGLPSSDSFATVLTDLQLVSDWPSRIYEEDRTLLQVRLYDSKKPVVLPRMTGVVRYAFQITPTDRVSEPVVREFLVDNGKQGDQQAKDGIFSSYVKIEEQGEYRLRVVARGPTFERQQEIPFRVKPRIISLSVHSVEMDGAAGHGHAGGEEGHEESLSRDYFRVELSPEAMSLKKVKIKLHAIDEERKKFELPLSKSHDNSLIYEVAADTLPHDGKYKLKASFTADDKRRNEMSATSRVLEYTRIARELDHYTDAGTVMVVEDAATVVEGEKKKEKPPSSIPYVILAGIINAACGGALLFMLKKKQGNVGFEIADFVPPENVVQGIAILRERLSVSEVDVRDPRFEDPSVKFLTKEELESGTLKGVAASVTVAPVAPASTSTESETEDIGGEDSASDAEDNPESEESGDAEPDQGDDGDEEPEEESDAGDADEAGEETAEEISEEDEELKE